MDSYTVFLAYHKLEPRRPIPSKVYRLTLDGYSSEDIMNTFYQSPRTFFYFGLKLFWRW